MSLTTIRKLQFECNQGQSGSIGSCPGPELVYQSTCKGVSEFDMENGLL